MELVLRPYQQHAVNATYKHLNERADNPIVVLPTAAGKGVLIAQFCADVAAKWKGRVLVLAHVKELLEQSAGEIQKLCPDLNVGINSAGLGRRDEENDVIVAGIQSVWRKPEKLGPFQLIIVDEAHMITMEGEGMYRTFLKEMKIVNPHVRIAGLTATPYRLNGGVIAKEDHFLNHVCYEAGIRELIAQGYICKLISKRGKTKADLSGVKIRGGEFVESELQKVMNDADLVTGACGELVQLTADRKTVLVFATGIHHAKRVANTLGEVQEGRVETIFGSTKAKDRAAIIKDFREGKIKFLINVGVMTTGFNATNIDCVVMLRPTMSPGLMVQMIGRGFRLHEGKEDCLILDYSNNIMRHGPVDKVKPPRGDEASRGEKDPDANPLVKECPKCEAIVEAVYLVCVHCGYEFPPPEVKHSRTADEADVLSGNVTKNWAEVVADAYEVYQKKGTDGSRPEHTTLKVEYEIGPLRYQSEWVCFNHSGYARRKAENWWQQRSNAPLPSSVDEAFDLIRAGAISETTEILIRDAPGDEYPRSIVGHKVSDKPEWPPVEKENKTSEPESFQLPSGREIPMTSDPDEINVQFELAADQEEFEDIEI